MHDLLKPLTKKMIAQLQSARAIELSATNGDRIITDTDLKDQWADFSDGV